MEPWGLLRTSGAVGLWAWREETLAHTSQAPFLPKGSAEMPFQSVFPPPNPKVSSPLVRLESEFGHQDITVLGLLVWSFWLEVKGLRPVRRG